MTFKGEYSKIPVVPLKMEYMEIIFEHQYLTKPDARKWLVRKGVIFEEQTPIGIQPKGSEEYPSGRVLQENHTVHIWTATQANLDFEELWSREAKLVTIRKPNPHREEVIHGKLLLKYLANLHERYYRSDAEIYNPQPQQGMPDLLPWPTKE